MTMERREGNGCTYLPDFIIWTGRGTYLARFINGKGQVA